MWTKLAGSAKGSPFERLPPAGGRCRRQATKRGTSCRRRRLRGFVLEATLSVTASPCHLPRRWRLWQGRKVYSLTAGFFMPLTNKGETCRFCQGLSLRESCRRRRLRGFVPEATLSVTASPCHLPRRWRLWQRRKVYSLTAGFFLSLTNEDETYPLCQGLSLRKTSPGRGKMSPIGDKKGNQLSSAARRRWPLQTQNPAHADMHRPYKKRFAR